MQTICENCRYWAGLPLQPGHGECRKSPPSAVLIQTQQGVGVQTFRPVTESANWCGEFNFKRLKDESVN